MSYTPTKSNLRILRNGSDMDSIIEYSNSGTTTSGSITFYLTQDATASTTALFTQEPMVMIRDINDSNGLYGKGWSMSGDYKSLTITVTRQAFTGITVLGIPVLGSVTLSAAVNGTEVSIYAIGK